VTTPSRYQHPPLPNCLRILQLLAIVEVAASLVEGAETRFKRVVKLAEVELPIPPEEVVAILEIILVNRSASSVARHRRLLNIVGYSTSSVTQHRR
jgi:hypothetical protein